MEKIKDLLSAIDDTELNIKPFLKKNISIKDENEVIVISVALGFLFTGLEDRYKKLIISALNHINKSISINFVLNISSHQTQGSTQSISNIKNIIAVASGKGGVGKSTIACNLAISLKKLGAKVGILDADIYGPSQPKMMGISDKPESLDGKKLQPLTAFDVETMSIGYLVDPDTPVVWRGPMVTNTLQQLLNETNWSDLDYLVIDLPPGTGDTQLTLAQKVPVTGAVIVTTPQDIALIDAQKGIGMFEKVNIPNLGIIENMAVFECPNCGHHEHIFGNNGGKKIAEKNNIELLGSIPLKSSIQKNMDLGTPSVINDPDSLESQEMLRIARKISVKIAQSKENFKDKFPKIVIE